MATEDRSSAQDLNIHQITSDRALKILNKKSLSSMLQFFSAGKATPKYAISRLRPDNPYNQIQPAKVTDPLKFCLTLKLLY
jgi:hypothetical protein